MRCALALKRVADLLLAALLLVATLPLTFAVAALLVASDDGWFEERWRLGRGGRTIALLRFHRPAGAAGRLLEQVGALDLPLLLAVLAGRMSFVGPRALAPDADVAAAGARLLMTPGLTGPGQRADLPGPELDDGYVEQWSPLADLRLLATAPRRTARAGSPLT
jgi:lipopolysaccharide/colanic/teichoic acid biosynthesis glycosyltransferase